MSLDRRSFLRFGAGVALTGGLAGCATSPMPEERLITEKKFAGLRKLGPVLPKAEVCEGALKGKIACKYMDDCIWFLRDLARTRPRSAFDHPFLAGLRDLHEKYGLKTQLNLFYRTDFYYGMDEFALADMPDAYKRDFQRAAGWLRLGFHSLQEFPDYPWLNADYEDVDRCLKKIRGEVVRFAGEELFAKALVPHWVPMSKDGVRALVDNGIKIMYATAGDRYQYEGDPDVLPYGHDLRFACRRKPETALYTRVSYSAALAASLCGYNHITAEQQIQTNRFNRYARDRETGMCFRDFCTRPMRCINIPSMATLAEQDLKPVLGCDFIGYGDHEQYFFPEYFLHQPDYFAKEEYCAKTLAENGYRFAFMEELV